MYFYFLSIVIGKMLCIVKPHGVTGGKAGLPWSAQIPHMAKSCKTYFWRHFRNGHWRTEHLQARVCSWETAESDQTRKKKKKEKAWRRSVSQRDCQIHRHKMTALESAMLFPNNLITWPSCCAALNIVGAKMIKMQHFSKCVFRCYLVCSCDTMHGIMIRVGFQPFVFKARIPFLTN